MEGLDELLERLGPRLGELQPRRYSAPVATPGWYQDPYSRFEFRYYDGSAWTPHTSIGGRQVIDPDGAGPARTVTQGQGPPPPPAVAQATQTSYQAVATQQPQATSRVARAGNGLAVAALVLGLIGLLAGLVPIFFFIAFPCGVLAVVFGFAGRRSAIRHDAPRKGMAIWGMVLGVGALILSVVGIVILDDAVEDFEDAFESSPPPVNDVSGGAPVSAAPGADASTSAADLAIQFGFTQNVERGVVSAGALISNNGALTACGVEVQFTLLDSAGTPVDTVTESITLVPAGQTVSVVPLQIGYQVADPASMSVTIIDIADTTDEVSLRDCSGFYFEDGIIVDVVNPTYSRREFDTSIIGQLVNPTEQMVETAFIDCVLRFGGQIVGGESSASLNPITPGGTIAFELGFVTYEGEADEVLCTAIG